MASDGEFRGHDWPPVPRLLDEPVNWVARRDPTDTHANYDGSAPVEPDGSLDYGLSLLDDPFGDHA